MADHDSPSTVGYAVFCGVDVGKSDHHACALDQGGNKIHDKALPNDQAALTGVLTALQSRGRVLVVVDQAQSDLVKARTAAQERDRPVPAYRELRIVGRSWGWLKLQVYPAGEPELYGIVGVGVAAPGSRPTGEMAESHHRRGWSQVITGTAGGAIVGYVASAAFWQAAPVWAGSAAVVAAAPAGTWWRGGVGGYKTVRGCSLAMMPGLSGCWLWQFTSGRSVAASTITPGRRPTIPAGMA